MALAAAQPRPVAQRVNSSRRFTPTLFRHEIHAAHGAFDPLLQSLLKKSQLLDS
ncbi:hypothetical protein [Mesorhizobium sp.]|uniref:hypothetical protein n=1 Tax=Mesorhizobium sp. TaxID=1871066 RepID=UPI0025FF884A|nr:hypothetical protein [Mesorhizobium sp.]